MPTDLLSQIEAAAALGAKATQRPWAVDPLKIGTPWNIESVNDGYDIAMAQQQVSPKDDPAQAGRHANAAYIVAAANLPLSAIAEELRTARAAREAAERERDIQIQGNCRLSNDLEAIIADRDRLAAECESLRAVVERLVQAVDQMAATEVAGGSDWWRAWDKVRYESARAKKPEACGATTETDSGEYVSPCRKPKGHDGDHEGSCLGSRAVWRNEAAAAAARLAGKGGSDAR